MIKLFSVLVFVMSAKAFADETYKFDCTASFIDSKGNISKLTFSEDGAALDGQFLDASDIGASKNQSLVKSTNKYVNGKSAKVLNIVLTENLPKSKYDGYPKNDPTNVVANIFSITASVQTENGPAKTYFGICSEQYQGD